MTGAVPGDPGRRLRALLDQADTAIAVAGGATPLEALCAARAGFEAFYVSGYAAAAWRYGLPDVGLTGLAEITDTVGAIASVAATLLFVDADTGYGDVSNVVRTVQALERAGAAAIQIEDQVSPKRCGHLDGKQVIPADDMVRKVRAASAGRLSPDTVIVARTDALAPLGLGEAITRANRYADAGGDVIFVDAPESVEDLEAIATQVDAPLIVNMSESGKTPILPLAELDAMGFNIAIYPTAALRLAVGVIDQMFQSLRRDGSTSAWVNQMMTMDDLNALLGLDELRRFEDGLGADR
jgi:2-methylisocitrate lyase-like PEP mutase family enzyme